MVTDKHTAQNQVLNDIELEENDIMFRNNKANNKMSNKVSNQAKNISNNKQKDIFKVLTYDQYEELYKRKYRVIDLRKMCNHYNLKTYGNKEELIARMYEYLKKSHSVCKIQGVWKKRLIKQLIISRGPGYKNREKCVNETDFYTMEDIKDIPCKQFISFQDKEGCIYGFNILSIYNMVLKTRLPLNNPYNREEIDKKFIQHLYSIIKISKILGASLELQIEEPEQWSREKRVEMRALTLFQDINELGNYSEHTWFSTLNKIKLIRFITELIDIWNYRAQLSNDVKREICPPYGEPFIDTNLHFLPRLETIELQEKCLSLIDKLINSGINNSSKALGANFVLCGLTLVNQDAANALPWLYESVAPNVF